LVGGEQVDGWMGGWIHGWVGGWMDTKPDRWGRLLMVQLKFSEMNKSNRKTVTDVDVVASCRS
jgi:hypothetical protein